MKGLLAVSAAILSALPAWAGYQYYVTDNLTAIDASKWVVTGALTPTGSGIAAPDANGGSMVSRLPAPDGTSDGEVRMTIALIASGGTYTQFLQASANARTGSAGSGAYLAFEMQNPVFDSAGPVFGQFSGTAEFRGNYDAAGRLPTRVQEWDGHAAGNPRRHGLGMAGPGCAD